MYFIYSINYDSFRIAIDCHLSQSGVWLNYNVLHLVK